MTEIIQVVTTTSTRDEAQRIADALVARHLAACVQVFGPIASTYRWQGQVQHGEEWACTIKTRRALYAEVERAIRELHSYETPEILATPVEAGAERYLAWLTSETEP